jgi:hypothetical protein
LKELLKGRLVCPHDLTIVPNTTLALSVTLLFVVARDWVPVALHNGSYAPYRRWLRYLLGPNLVAPHRRHLTALMTHVCPTTGAVQDLRRDGACKIGIVDAAQSLGTVLNRDLFESSAVFAAPLHKNLGLAAGLGLIGVRWEDVPAAHRAALREHLMLAEHGTMSRSLLDEAIRAVETHTSEELTNRARITVGPRLVGLAEEIGLRVLTPEGPQAHIVSFKADPPRKIPEMLNLPALGGKYDERSGILRLSFHSARLPVEGEGMPMEEVVVRMLRGAAR